MKIPKGYKIIMVYYDTEEISWEIFSGKNLIDYGTVKNENKARRMINRFLETMI